MATKITIKNNSALIVEGDFELYDESGQKIDLAGRSKVSLCRCGASEKKPFCDGKHKACGFASTIDAKTL